MSILDDARPILAETLRREEGLRLKPYLCSAGVPTIGIGATTYPDGRKVCIDDDPITEEAALRMLAIECDYYLMSVLKLCTQYPTAHQLAAMSSLAYNIGLGGFGKSTVLRLHNTGDTAGASRAFAMWNKATVGGKLTVLQGLVSRRAREAALYLEPDDASAEPMPQAVADEPQLAKSPTATVSTAGAVAGVAGVFAQMGDGVQAVSQPIQSIKGFVVDLVGLPSAYWPWTILATICAVTLYRRLKQRREGVA